MRCMMNYQPLSLKRRNRKLGFKIAHYFIPAQYWKDNFELVKKMLLQAEVYVYKNGHEIQGFIGLSGEQHIEGIFASEEMQSRGIGRPCF